MFEHFSTLCIKELNWDCRQMNQAITETQLCTYGFGLNPVITFSGI